MLKTYSRLSPEELETLVDGAEILEQDSFGPKVYRLANGDIFKLFRRKRLLSSALLRPHSLRFVENAAALTAMGIPTLTPLQLFRLQTPERTAVLYQPLPGETLSHLLRKSPEQWPSLLPRLAGFINHLHERGVYFRSLHLGNIVQTPSGELGLIDVADLRVRRRALNSMLIERNREHFEKYMRKECLDLDIRQLWEACERLKHQRNERVQA